MSALVRVNSGTPSRRRSSEPRKRTRRSSYAEHDTSSDTLNEIKENSHTSNKKPVAKAPSLSKRQQDSVDVTKGQTKRSPGDSGSKQPRITHPSYCITIVGCRDDLDDPEWVGNGQPVHKVTKTVLVDHIVSPFGV